MNDTWGDLNEDEYLIYVSLIVRYCYWESVTHCFSKSYTVFKFPDQLSDYDTTDMTYALLVQIERDRNDFEWFDKGSFLFGWIWTR